MSKINIIAISGWKRSGKDTSANYLIDIYNCKRVAFADPLKDMVAEQFSLNRLSIDDPSLKETPILDLPVNPKDDFSRTIAEFMFKEFRSACGQAPEKCGYLEGQFMGTIPHQSSEQSGKMETLYWTRRALCILKGSTMRSADSNYWVNLALEKTKAGGIFVISDLRYRSEMEALNNFAEKNDGKIVSVRIQRFETSSSDDPSERDLDNYSFDYLIKNEDGRLYGLLSSLDDIMADNFIHLRGGFN
jgi:hypothetical protein